MPKAPIKWENTLIYKIQHNDKPELLYVGSTTDFVKRKSQHKRSCNNPKAKEYNQKKYVTMRQNDGWDAFTMVLIENFPCTSRWEATARENKIMHDMKATLNSNNSVSLERFIFFSKIL